MTDWKGFNFQGIIFEISINVKSKLTAAENIEKRKTYLAITDFKTAAIIFSGKFKDCNEIKLKI